MEFGVLGPLAIWRDGRELDLGSPKQRAVLARLVLRANEVIPPAAGTAMCELEAVGRDNGVEGDAYRRALAAARVGDRDGLADRDVLVLSGLSRPRDVRHKLG